MGITVILGILLLGMILIVVEFLLTPGIIFPGILGLVLVFAAVYLVYEHQGPRAGLYTLLASVAFLILTLSVSLRSKTWKRVTLSSQVESKMPSLKTAKLKVGDSGIAISRIAPMGRVLINDQYIEAKSLNIYIDENTAIEVVKILKTNIIVKPKTES